MNSQYSQENKLRYIEQLMKKKNKSIFLKMKILKVLKMKRNR